MTIRVLIADDHAILRDGLKALLSASRDIDIVAEVGNGVECGMAFRGFQDIQEGDIIECFTLEEVKRSL